MEKKKPWWKSPPMPVPDPMPSPISQPEEFAVWKETELLKLDTHRMELDAHFSVLTPVFYIGLFLFLVIASAASGS